MWCNWENRSVYITQLNCVNNCLPSVLWHCWLGSRKGIRPVKKLSGEVLAWLSVWSMVQMICIWSSWCHCHPIISCSSKIQNGLPFWCQLTQVVLEKRLLKGCSSLSTSEISRKTALLCLFNVPQICKMSRKNPYPVLNYKKNLQRLHFCSSLYMQMHMLYVLKCASVFTVRIRLAQLKWTT